MVFQFHRLQSAPVASQLRFKSLRKAHLTSMINNPKSRPRHEKVDIELFTRKKETDYVDVKTEPWNLRVSGFGLQFPRLQTGY